MVEPRATTSEGVARAYTPTALPSVTARLLAFVAILLGGFCGGLIGYSVTDLQCGPATRVEVGGGTTAIVTEQASDIGVGEDEGCGTATGLGAVGGAVVGAGGVAVVAVLVLRAMAEWRKELDVGAHPNEDLPTPS